MQIGTRWKVGAEPPARLPDSVKEAIARTEAGVEHLDTARWRWTLTWLENRPVVELDDGTTIRVGHDGTVTVTREEDPSDEED
jgi:hypothetical protein